jgi:hypothetical protein
MNQQQVQFGVALHDLRPQLSAKIMQVSGYRPIVSLMERCWAKNPQDRPPFKGCFVYLVLPFFVSLFLLLVPFSCSIF